MPVTAPGPRGTADRAVCCRWRCCRRGRRSAWGRNIVYRVDIDVTRPLVVLSVDALAGGLIMAGGGLIRQRAAAIVGALPAVA